MKCGHTLVRKCDTLTGALQSTLYMYSSVPAESKRVKNHGLLEEVMSGR